LDEKFRPTPRRRFTLRRTPRLHLADSGLEAESRLGEFPEWKVDIRMCRFMIAEFFAEAQADQVFEDAGLFHGE
jgi:hypothetical protein